MTAHLKIPTVCPFAVTDNANSELRILWLTYVCLVRLSSLAVQTGPSSLEHPFLPGALPSQGIPYDQEHLTILFFQVFPSSQVCHQNHWILQVCSHYLLRFSSKERARACILMHPFLHTVCTLFATLCIYYILNLAETCTSLYPFSPLFAR